MSKWFGNLKIKSRMFFIFGWLLMSMIVFAVFAAARLARIQNQARELIDTYRQRLELLAESIIDIDRIRFTNLYRVYTAVEENAVNKVAEILDEEAYLGYARSLVENMARFREIVSDDANLTDEQKEYRLGLAYEIENIFSVYISLSDELKFCIDIEDRQATVRLYERVVPIGNSLSARLQELHSVCVNTMKTSMEMIMAASARTTVATLIITLVCFTLVAAFALIVTANSLNRPIIKLNNAVAEITGGNLAYPIRSDKTDEIGVLTNRIGDMVDKISEMNKTITVIDYLDCMICIVDMDYNIVYINDNMAKAHGVDKGSCLNRKCYKVLKCQDKQCSYCQLANNVLEQGKNTAQNLSYVWDERLGMWLGGSVALIRWIDGSTVHFHYLMDKTAEKNYEESLHETKLAAEESSRSKSVFLANMSHELRTPLNVIIGLTELSLEEESLPESVRNNLTSVSDAGTTLLSIVNDILDISKIESGKLSLVPIVYQTSSLLNDTITMLKTYIGEKPIVFKPQISEKLPAELFGDDIRVKQVLNNLLSNAVKYTNKGSVELIVSSEISGSYVWVDITVRDTGIGINKEDLKGLFSEYYQADAKTNRKTQGTGLGLAITRKLLDLMNGSITVESEYGVGTTFHARLRQGFAGDTPIGAEVAERLCRFDYHDIKRHASNKLVRADLSHARVLIVDDMQNNLDVSAGLMRKYKLTADCVTSGQTAIEKISLAEPVYDAVFMDHMMPEMDGVETAKRIRALGSEYARKVPIIALTANAVAGTNQLFFDNGFQDFLTKPIDIVQLDSVLRKWLRRGAPNETGEAPPEPVSPSGPNEAPGPVSPVNIPGVNAQKAISNYGGETDIFLAALRSYAANVQTVVDKLRGVRPEGLPGATVNAHGLKGASANICAERVRKGAAEMEDAARKGDFEKFSALAEPLLQEAELLIKNIRDWFSEYDKSSQKPRRPAPDKAVLARLAEGCKAYDMSVIDEAMEILEGASYDAGGELVAWLREKVDVMETGEIIARLAP